MQTGCPEVRSLSLNEDERFAVKAYSNQDSFEINDRLRNPGEQANQQVQAHYAKMTADIDSAISKGTLKSELKVYRGIPPPESKSLESLKEGDVISDKGFSSTSRDFNEGKKFARGDDDDYNNPTGVVMHITAPKGAHVLDVTAHVGDWESAHVDREKEVLMPRGARLRVTQVIKGSATTPHHIHAIWEN